MNRRFFLEHKSRAGSLGKGKTKCKQISPSLGFRRLANNDIAYHFGTGVFVQAFDQFFATEG